MGYHASINCNLLGDLRKKKKKKKKLLGLCVLGFLVFLEKTSQLTKRRGNFLLPKNKGRRLPVTFLNSPTYKPHPHLIIGKRAI